MKFSKYLAVLLVIASCSCASFGQQENQTQLPNDNSNNRNVNFSNYQVPQSADQNVNGRGMIEINGSNPEVTQAEKLQLQENEFNRRIGDLALIIDGLDKRVSIMRKQTDAPTMDELDRIDRDLSASEKELSSLVNLVTSQIGRAQCSDLQERLFYLRLSIDILNRRWGLITSVFGLDFFQNTNSQRSITQRIATPSYKIRIGDKLRFLVLSSMGAQNEYRLQVDKTGGVVIAGMGRVSVVGRSIKQVEDLVSSKIASKFKQLDVKITVEEMSPIQVQVSGEITNPGTYTLHGQATVFDAISQAGGITKSGTFRAVTLVRDGQPNRKIDLYDFLLSGDKNQDRPLEDRDLIFIPPVGPTLAIDGEVNRPGRYEPNFPITLGQALKMAGGAKSTGYLQNVQVERVENSQYKVLMSEPISADGKANFVLKPGDTIMVSSVRKDKTNQVSIEGPVASPGLYGFKDGMRVAELIKLAQGLSDGKEVYRERADILRVDPVKGAQIVSFNLAKALQEDSANNIQLNKLDRVFIYEPDQVVFRPKLVTLMGAVARPGTYKRTGGMRVSDAIAAAGGVMPQAYLVRADLIRRKEGTKTELLKIDLQSALNGDPEANVNLQDRDELTLYTQSEVQWQDHSVRIEGAVQRQGVYVRSDNMRLSDLLFIAGGLLPEAVKTAEVARCVEFGKSGVSQIDLANLKYGSEKDVLLCDGDVVTIASFNPHLRTPEIVYITGEVAKPGPYALNNQSEKLADVIARAGGLTDFADCNGMLFLRLKESFENHQQEKDSDIILQKTKMFADKQLMVQLAKMGVTTAPATVAQLAKDDTDKTSKPADVVADKKIEGRSDDTVALVDHSVGNTYENSQETPVSAMGLPISDNEKLASLTFKGNDVNSSVINSARISVNFSRALENQSSPDNLPLRNGDRVFIPKKTNVVTVIGAVLHPHSFAAGSGKDVSYYIQRSGGYAVDAESKHVIVVRANGDALPQTKVKSVEPGDMIVVPTTGMIDVAKKWENVGSITKVISDVLSTAFILTKF